MTSLVTSGAIAESYMRCMRAVFAESDMIGAPYGMDGTTATARSASGTECSVLGWLSLS